MAFYSLAVFIALVINVVASSQTGPSVLRTGDPIKLSYHYPADKPVKYVYITNVAQNLECKWTTGGCKLGFLPCMLGKNIRQNGRKYET